MHDPPLLEAGLTECVLEAPLGVRTTCINCPSRDSNSNRWGLTHRRPKGSIPPNPCATAARYPKGTPRGACGVQIDNPTFSPSSDVSTPFKVPERITCETDQPPTPPDAAAQPLLAPAERSLAAPPQSRAHRLRAALLRALAACAPRRKHAPDTSDAALRALPAGTLVRCVVHPVDRTPSAAASACSDACSDAANDADDEADSCDLRGPGTGQSFGVHTAESSTDHLPPTPVPPLPLKFPKEWLTTGTAAVRAIPGFASMPSARGREGAMVLAIEAALNRAYQDKDILAGCFMLLGPGQRWRDATGIVQVRAGLAAANA